MHGRTELDAQIVLMIKKLSEMRSRVQQPLPHQKLESFDKLCQDLSLTFEDMNDDLLAYEQIIISAAQSKNAKKQQKKVVKKHVYDPYLHAGGVPSYLAGLPSHMIGSILSQPMHYNEDEEDDVGEHPL